MPTESNTQTEMGIMRTGDALLQWALGAHTEASLKQERSQRRDGRLDLVLLSTQVRQSGADVAGSLCQSCWRSVRLGLEDWAGVRTVRRCSKKCRSNV